MPPDLRLGLQRVRAPQSQSEHAQPEHARTKSPFSSIEAS